MMSRSLLRLRQLCLRWVLGTRGCAKKMTATMATKSFTADVDLKGEEGSISRGSIEVCRLMAPDDANIAGNVHGGTTLKVIEEAGLILATRHCNKNNAGNRPAYGTLARVERTDFLQPLYIGEVAEVHVHLGYTSKHSVEVMAFLWAENLITGSRRLTNRASMWYVPVITGSGEMRVIPEVPAIEYASQEEEEMGRERYLRQKRARQDKEEHLKKVCKFQIPNN